MIFKTFRRYYFATALILLGAASVPLWHFGLMLDQYFFGGWTWFNITLVIPFMAVSVSILLGFLLLPLLNNVSQRRSHLIMLIYSALAFVGLSRPAERISTRLGANEIIWNSRAPHWVLPPDEILVISRHWIPPDETLVMSRAPPEWIPPDETLVISRRWIPPGELAESAIISAEMRIHYYIFSIVLVVAVLSLLYNFAQTRYVNGQPGKRFLTLQGAVTACYTLAYFLVRIVQYENFATRHITPGSVINAAVCFMLAALVMGLWCISFLRSTKYVKIVPPLVAVLTGLLLYGAQYLMLGGQFYLYSESIFISFYLRNLIVVIPGIAVYLLLKFVLKNEWHTQQTIK